MQLRRFTADSTPAALGAVRQALGDDAIILANRKVGDQVEIIATGQMEDGQALAEISMDDTGGHLSPDFDAEPLSDTSLEEDIRHQDSTTFEELTAAIDAVAQKTEPVTFGSTASSVAPHTFAETPRSNGQQAASSLDVRGSDKTGARSKVNPTNGKDRSSAAKSASVTSNPRAPHRETLQSEMQKLTAGIDDAVTQHNELLMRTLEAQSNMINEHFKGLEVNLWGNNSPNRRLHLQRLFAMGIGAELAVQLAERADPNASLDEALRHSFALLKSTLPIGVDKTLSVPGVTIFAGPTGAGKTTALMKIATQHVKENGCDSIVIICADTRRIGAFEELQAYGRLLGVPTVHAHDSSELDSLLTAFTHKQLILIDHTLPMDDDAVEIPRRLLKPDLADSVRQLLVLSATTQSATVDALISRHCEGRSMRCVLTHLDANARLGEMFNAIIRHHLPIAYWSDTASVQTPLQKAEASVLIATAAAMSRRLVPTPDDEWLLRLVQPSDKLMSPLVNTKKSREVNA